MNIKEQMLRFLTYSKTESHVTSVVRATYTCNALCCDFRAALKEIHENPDLRVYRFSDALVSTINDNPREFIPHCVDGYRFQYRGMDLVHLQRLDKDGIPKQRAATAIIELEDMDIHPARKYPIHLDDWMLF